MTAPTTSAPTIPPPPPGHMVSAAWRALFHVKIGDVQVICDYLSTRIAFRTVRDRGYISALDLEDAVVKGADVGKRVIAADLGCGGLPLEDCTTVTGSAEDLRAARAAIPCFYAELRDPEGRKALRWVYRRLDGWIAEQGQA